MMGSRFVEFALLSVCAVVFIALVVFVGWAFVELLSSDKPVNQGGEADRTWISSVCRYDPPLGVWVVINDGSYTGMLFIREMTESEFVKFCEGER